MLKKTIKYTNFNDEEKVQEVYFHLGKADITRIAADASVLQEMNEAAAQQDKKKMLATIERLVRMAYGVRSEDGERFVKTPEIQDAFIHSAAYEEFLMDVLTTENGFTNFIEGVFPPKVMKELRQTMETVELPEGMENPFREPLNPESNKGEPAIEDTRPNWLKENRKPTRQELLVSTKEEMLEAFRMHPGLSSEKI